MNFIFNWWLSLVFGLEGIGDYDERMMLYCVMRVKMPTDLA
jgi:hypothetical protein